MFEGQINDEMNKLMSGDRLTVRWAFKLNKSTMNKEWEFLKINFMFRFSSLKQNWMQDTKHWARLPRGKDCCTYENKNFPKLKVQAKTFEKINSSLNLFKLTFWFFLFGILRKMYHERSKTIRKFVANTKRKTLNVEEYNQSRNRQQLQKNTRKICVSF